MIKQWVIQDLTTKKISKVKKKSIAFFLNEKEEEFILMNNNFRLYLQNGTYISPGVNNEILLGNEKKFTLTPFSIDVISLLLSRIDQKYKLEKIIINSFYPNCFKKTLLSDYQLEKLLKKEDITNDLRNVFSNGTMESTQTIFFDSLSKYFFMYLHVTCEREINFIDCKDLLFKQLNKEIEVREIKKDKYCPYAFSTVIMIKNYQSYKIKRIEDYFKVCKDIVTVHVL